MEIYSPLPRLRPGVELEHIEAVLDYLAYVLATDAMLIEQRGEALDLQSRPVLWDDNAAHQLTFLGSVKRTVYKQVDGLDAQQKLNLLADIAWIFSRASSLELSIWPTLEQLSARQSKERLVMATRKGLGWVRHERDAAKELANVADRTNETGLVGTN